MVHIRFKYLVEDRDRHGNVRLYVRIRGRRKVRIRAPFGTDEFVAEYNAAVSDHVGATRQAGEIKTGSFRHLCSLYYASATFKRLDKSTRSWRRRALDDMCAKHADKPVTRMEARHVRALRDERSEHPAVANIRLKALKALFAWACEEKPEIAPTNPTVGVRKIKYASDGHHSWTPEEIAQFRERHPLGTKPRLALDLLVYTGGRREDAVRLGPQHVRNGRVKFRQAKNEHRNPIDIDIPLHPELAASIAAAPTTGHMSYLVTAFGRPFTPAGFGNWFRDHCDQANLRHCSAHGLRKSTAAALAEAGATVHEIAAVTGHMSLEEIERYTRAARKTKLADAAIAKLK
jgi:integrase/recombinase XerD